jgi:hypothetical protein
MHLRAIIHNKIIKFLEKLKCEKCGSKNNLEIHHSLRYKFSDILCDSLEILNLSYKKYWKEYSESEIKSIEVMVLGFHLYTKFVVLCSECHDGEHIKNIKTSININKKMLPIKYRSQLENFKLKYPNTDINNFFNKYNKFYLKEFVKKYKFLYLNGEEKELLRKDLFDNLIIEHINYFSKIMQRPNINIKRHGILVINKILELYDIQYCVISKRNNTGENKNKNYWMVDSIKNPFIKKKKIKKQKILINIKSEIKNKNVKKEIINKIRPKLLSKGNSPK